MKIKNCPLCNQEAFIFSSKQVVTYFRCNNCETIFQFPLPTLQEMMSYANTEYKDGLYKEYLDANDLKYSTFDYRLKKVIEVFRNRNHSEMHPRILDIGCSNGRFIEIAVQNGIDAWGLELSESAIAAATPEIRARIYHEDANNITSLGVEKFNIVTAFDLVEHLFDPISFLINLQNYVTKNGIIIITTPDSSSFFRIIMGKNWSMLQPYQHTILLSRKSALRLIEITGFKHLFTHSTKKYFSLDYLFGQLQTVNPHLHQFYNRTKFILPHKVRSYKFSLNIGEMMIGAFLD